MSSLLVQSEFQTIITEKELSEKKIKAKQMQGFLKKKSPAVLKSWQKRYFMIVQNDQGYSLAYYNNEVKISIYQNNIYKSDSKPIGHLDIECIMDIHFDGEQIFNIIYPGRNFELKAKTKEIRHNWAKNILLIKKYIDREKQLSGRKDGQRHQSMKIGLKKQSEGKEWKKIDGRTLSEIAYYKETHQQNAHRDSQTTHLKSTNELVSNEDLSRRETLKNQNSKKGDVYNNIDSDYVLQKSGIASYFPNINDPFISNRILYGFLAKRSMGKVKYFMKRWFVLISAKSVSPFYSDEKILPANQLPPWMELDCLYYFKAKTKDDIGTGLLKVKMADVLGINEKDMLIRNFTQSTSKEEGFSFSIEKGEEIFLFMSETEFDRKTWVTGLKISMKTAKEMQKGIQGNIEIKKNIDLIIQSYDSTTSYVERRNNLREKIDKDIEGFKNQHLKDRNLYICYIMFTIYTSPQDTKELISYLDILKDEILNIMNACLAKEIKRQDIIKEYIDYFHEIHICKMLTQFWDKYYSQIDPLSLVNLCDWIYNYSAKLSSFFQDERLILGIKTLLKIYAHRIQQSSLELVSSIIDFEQNQTNPQSNELVQLGILTSQTPFDLYKLLNELFERGYSMCKQKEMAITLAGVGKQIIVNYQSQLNELLDDRELEIEQLICICNNTIQFSNLTTQYNERLQTEANLSEEEAQKYFDSQYLKKQFVTLADLGHDIIFRKLYSNINHLFHKKEFIKLDLGHILQHLVDDSRHMVRLLHDRFSRKLWKMLLENIVMFYFQLFIISCQKSKKSDDLPNFLNKLQQDQEFLQENFQDLVFQQTIVYLLKPFEEINEFLNEDSGFNISKSCRTLRQVFGPGFTSKTVKSILELRKDLDKKERQEMYGFCVETIELYNKENAEEEENKNKMGDILGKETLGFNHYNEHNFIGEETDSQSDNDPNETTDDLISNFHKRQYRKTIVLDDITGFQKKQPIQQEAVLEQNGVQEEELLPIEEGYLGKRKAKSKMFVTKFFRIREGFLYWYDNNKSKYSRNKLDLSKVEDVTGKEGKLTFTLVFDKKQGKKSEYKYKAASVKERDQWVNSLRKNMDKVINLKQDQMQNEIINVKKEGTTPPLFRDYEEIQRKEQALQQALLRQEKILEQKKQRQKQAASKKQQQNNQQCTHDEDHESPKNQNITLSQTPNLQQQRNSVKTQKYAFDVDRNFSTEDGSNVKPKKGLSWVQDDPNKVQKQQELNETQDSDNNRYWN